ncbi:MAG: hypothetical protein HND27_09700 [Bacteroidetes bacterium]|nr:hypothetical protein [Bacteroidota bacterium]MBV6462542.1 hypothetical protein [Flavobacteriales bacterium]WKZ75166.1 MAG: hypothetical protein QY303_13560 [Vicingaceae bacterium]MCL4817374.1 hypothetical protein [Flavobacteriales bacterium]NOG96037.1 hypothetical protein [Bacteroidota bacterium]
MSETTYQILLTKLDEFVRKYYKNQLLKGSIYALSFILLFYLVAVCLEYFGRFNSLARGLLFYSFCIGSLYVLVKLILYPLLQLYKIGKIITYSQAAKMIGNHFSEVQDKLLNVLQLKDLSENVSQQNELLIAGINQKITELKPIPFATAINLKENIKNSRYLAGVLFVILLIAIFSPSFFSDGTSRLVKYNEYFEVPSPFTFSIAPSSLKTPRNTDFDLQIQISGEAIPDKAFIDYNGTRIKLEKENKTTFYHTFKNIQTNIPFRLYADGFFSKEYLLEALPNPLILDFSIKADYPSYTGKTNEILKNTGDIIVPQGTKLKWIFNTRDAENLHFTMADSNVQITPSNHVGMFEFATVGLKSFHYSITASNQLISSKDTVFYTATVIPDAFPSIEVEEKNDSVNAKYIYFKGLIKDDYGFSSLFFKHRLVPKRGKPNDEKFVSTPIRFNKFSAQEAFFYVLNLNEYPIEPGDEMEYFFEVWDNDAVNGNKSARSNKHIYKALSTDELKKESAQKASEVKQELESSIHQAKRIQRELESLNKSLSNKNQASWEDKQKIENLLKLQFDLQRKMESIQQKNTKKNELRSEAEEIDPALLEKQEKLQELFDKLMTDEMKELFKQLEEMLDKIDKNQLQQELEKMNLNNEDLKKELDRSLELFKQLEVEQKLEDALKKLNELTQKQQELAKETEQSKGKNQEELKNKQEELNKEFNELRKEMDELEKLNKELENPNKLENTNGQEQEIENEMQNSKQQLENNKNKKASDSQQSAAEKMEKLAEKMQENLNAMQGGGEQQAEDLNKLREILENLIQLSFDQENLMKQVKNTNINDPNYLKLTQQQKRIKDDSKVIEDSLYALSKRIIQLEADINREISEINSHISKAIADLAERKKENAQSRQQFAMTGFNNLALLLDEAVQAMQQQMAQQIPGQGSCNKPGAGGKPKPGNASLPSMKQMQEQLNKQMQEMKKSMEKGNQQGPGMKPGQQGGMNMSKELAKMAAEQQALRQQLQQLSEQLLKNGKNGSNALDNISKLMEQTETDIVNKNITQETIRRQQDILTRLLEAENAEREREFDEKRESKEVKNYELSNPERFFEYNGSMEQQIELLKTMPPTFNRFYKEKVALYFKNIEQ